MGKKKIIIGIIVVVVLVLGGGVVWLLMSGNIGTVIPAAAGPEIQKASLNRVCDNKVVDTYNNVMNYQGGSTEQTLNEAAIKKLQGDVKGKSGYEADPTCQTILFWIAAHYSDYEGTKTAYAAINDLHEKGLFADSNLGSAAPLFVFKATVDSLAPEGQKGQ